MPQWRHLTTLIYRYFTFHNGHYTDGFNKPLAATGRTITGTFSTTKAEDAMWAADTAPTRPTRPG